MGGYAGIATAMAFATEYQGEATPHGHGFISFEDIPFMWKKTTNRDWDKAWAEAQAFKEKYETDVQFIFSRVQHHWHELDEKGNRIVQW